MNANDLGVGTRIPFRYGISSGIMVANAQISIPVRLDGASQFQLDEIVGTSNADVETNAKENNYTILIAQINGQAWSTLPVPQECICIQAQRGWSFKLPVILPAGYQMTFTFSDLGGGGTHLVELVGFMLRG